MSEMHDAVAAGVLGSEEDYRGLLQSIVEVARAIFAARASSIFLLDEEADELVFEAVSGEGSETLIGTRLPSSTGVAGWVLVTRQPIVLGGQNRELDYSTIAVKDAELRVLVERDDRAVGPALDPDAGPGGELVGDLIDEGVWVSHGHSILTAREH